MASKKARIVSTESNMLPHREANTAVVESVKVPSNRRTLFLAMETNALHDKLCDEMSFGALSPNDRATFQFLLYLTYCCKGQFLQVTLENPDYCTMSPPIREDFAHGRLFCFVLDMSSDDEWNIFPPTTPGAQSTSGTLSSSTSAAVIAHDEYVSGIQLLNAMDVSVNMDVFRRDDSEDDAAAADRLHQPTSAMVNETLDEAFNAFMRLQLVRNKVSSLNNAMVAMTDRSGELSAMFDWVDIRNDTLNSTKLERKKVKDLQGSLYTPASQSGRQVVVLPEPITDLSLKGLDRSISEITDIVSEGEGKTLFLSIMSKLTGVQWLKHKVVQTGYNAHVPRDVKFINKLKTFTSSQGCSSGDKEVRNDGLLVFRYSLEKLIDREKPDSFVKSLIHRHMPITRSRIDKVLCDIKSQRRTQVLAQCLNNGRCHCKERRVTNKDLCRLGGVCSGDCQTAYSCFYNTSEQHPFVVSSDDHSYYLAHLYPHLGKLERLSKEMKVKYKGRRQFETIADMVFNVLVRHQVGDNDSLYQGLSDVMDYRMSNSSLCIGHDLAEIHESLYLAPPPPPGNLDDDDHVDEHSSLKDPVKVYDHALVRYLFCDSLQVGRLFQASTTFNYIISNTAPRYTIERIMLFNITGPGEGKSYANNVLNYQFRKVRGCIETLTSFTPQAFKYKQKRNACVVMIDDAHITHEKNPKAVDRESNVIPNTFKNLLDTSVLVSDVVSRDTNSGKVDTVKYQAVHNCGFVWNTNTMGFVSEAWADRCHIMESEFPERVSRTRSTKQIQDTVEKCKMEHIAAVCLYRQNLVQSVTMIAESEIMQFGARFDVARDACVAALYASHIVCTGVVSRRVSLRINHLVFAEAMKLACHFVFDIWIPPWTKIPARDRHPDVRGYMKQLNENRLKALNELSFGQICLETNAVYKLCVAACLPDICPRVVDVQGRFACKVLGYVLTQIYAQHVKTSVKNGHLCMSGIDSMYFPEKDIKGGGDVAHEMLMLCATCEVPARGGVNPSVKKNYKLCTYRYAATTHHTAPRIRRSNPNNKKVSAVTVPLEAVYDMLAIYAPRSHSGFWDQLGAAMVEAYDKGDFEAVNAYGQCRSNERTGCDLRSQPTTTTTPRLTFTLDFSEDPVRSVILEATVAIEPLNELTFNKGMLVGETFRCSAPLYYGGVIRRALAQNAPKGAYNKSHLRESRLGPRGTFHGPRLSVYSEEYSGVPVKNASSFCTTRTVYDQDKIILTVDRGNRGHLAVELEEDWEWKDAADVLNKVHGNGAFSVAMLKRDYAVTMMSVKGELTTVMPRRSKKLDDMVKALRESKSHEALAMRTGKPVHSDTQRCRTPQRPHPGPIPVVTNDGGRQRRKRTDAQRSRDWADSQQPSLRNGNGKKQRVGEDDAERRRRKRTDAQRSRDWADSQPSLRNGKKKQRVGEDDAERRRRRQRRKRTDAQRCRDWADSQPSLRKGRKRVREDDTEHQG